MVCYQDHTCCHSTALGRLLNMALSVPVKRTTHRAGRSGAQQVVHYSARQAIKSNAKVSNLDKCRDIFSKYLSPQKKIFFTIHNLSQGTKTLHMSYGRYYSVIYLLTCDTATLKLSNLDKFREVFSKYLSPQTKTKCHHTESNTGHQDVSFELW